MRNILATTFAIALFQLTNPVNAIVTSGSDFRDNLAQNGFDNGVVQVYTNFFAGGTTSASGALLSSGGGQFIVTSAHLITNEFGVVDSNPTQVRIQRGNEIASHNFFFSNIEGFYINPLWNGNQSSGADIAIVKLATPAPLDIPRYEIATSVVTPSIATFVGWGNYGVSGLGENPSTVGYYRLSGQNRLDARWGVSLGRSLAYDFDNSMPEHDAFGYFVDSLKDVGINNEVMTAFGDSGGPVFVDGKIVGVVAFIGRYNETDIDGEINASFGEWGGATDATKHRSWITSITNPVPEPSEVILFLAGLTLIWTKLLRTRRRRVFYFFGLSVGNKITSRILCVSVSNITSLSIPIPTPADGGIPYSMASIKSSSSD